MIELHLQISDNEPASGPVSTVINAMACDRTTEIKILEEVLELSLRRLYDIQMEEELEREF